MPRQRGERPEPVRRRGEPFFDQLVEALYPPDHVRTTLHQLVGDQYAEAERISQLRGWGGAQPHGNDRYQYSLEQGRALNRLLPGAQMLRPKGSLLYRIGNAAIYPMRYGTRADDCPTSARITEASGIQKELASGLYSEQPTLFDLISEQPPMVVWLLFTGNSVEGGPLSAFVAIPGGAQPDGRIEWPQIEPLLGNYSGNGPHIPSLVLPQAPLPVIPPQPTPKLRLRP
jgi:hypothetical protein